MNEYSNANLDKQDRHTAGADNPYTNANLEAQEKQRLRSSVLDATRQNPDEYGRAKQVERQTGIPAPIATRNLIETEQRAKLTEYDNLLGTKTGTALQSPDFARLAHDDTRNLSDLERALHTGQKPVLTGAEFSDLVREIKRINPILGWDEARLAAQQRISGINNDKQNIGLQPPASTLKNKIDSVFTGTAIQAGQMGAGVKSMFADITDNDTMLGNAMRWREQLDRDARMTTPEMSATEKGVVGGLTSVLTQGPGLALGIMTGGAALPLTWAGAITQTSAYGKYRQRGGTAGEATAGSLLEGGIEVGTELAPMGFLVKKFGKAGMGEFLTGVLAREVPGEQLATFLQDATDTAIANPGKTWQQFLEERPGAAYETLIATLVQSGVMSAGHAAIEKLAGKGLRAQQAERDQEMLQRMAELTKANKVLQRDRPTFEAFIEAAAVDGPVQDVFISANSLMQAAGDALPELIQASPAIAAQIDEAVKVGNGDIRIPVGEYLAGVAQHTAGASLLPHLRTSADSMSVEEAKEFMQGQAEEFKQETEKILASTQFDAAFKESSAAVERELLAQLNGANRFNADVNATKAKFMAAFFTVYGAKMGRTPEEMYVASPLHVKATPPVGDRAMDHQGESDQDRSEREWGENYSRVVADIGSATTKDVYRAAGYAARVVSGLQKRAQRGEAYNVDLLRSMQTEHQALMTAWKAREDRFLAQAKTGYNGAQGDDNGQADTNLDFTGTADGAGKVVHRTVGGGPAAPGWAAATSIRRADGKPAAVYRGAATPLDAAHFQLDALGFASGNASAGLGVWFTVSEQEAASYGSVEPFYLDIRNPLVIKVEDLEGFDGGPEEAHAWREQQRAAGYDGLAITAKHIGGRVHIVAFDANQAIHPQDALEQAGMPPDVLTRWKASLLQATPRNVNFTAALVTPAVLKMMGVKAPKLELPTRYLMAIREKHRDIPPEVIENLPALLADPLFVYPYNEQTMNVVVDAATAKGEPIVVGVRDGRISTITPYHHNTVEQQGDNLTGAQRLSAAVSRAATRRGTKVYARNGDAPVVSGASEGAAQEITMHRDSHNGATVVTKAQFVKRQGGTLYQDTFDNETGEPDEVPPFYSQLVRLLETAKMNVAPASQWRTFINSLASKGVKKEEIEMSGVMDWLDVVNKPIEGIQAHTFAIVNADKSVAATGVSKEALELYRLREGQSIAPFKQTDRVTKQEVLDYLATNGTKVETLILGEPPAAEKKKQATAVVPATPAEPELTVDNVRLPDGYEIRMVNEDDPDDGYYFVKDYGDGYESDLYDTVEDARDAAYEFYTSVDEENPEVDALAREQWDNDADARAENHRESASQSDYVQYEIELRVPTYRIVELAPDLFRVEWVHYEGLRGIKDVADLPEPRFESANDEEFESYRDAVRWVERNSGNDNDYEFDDIEPHFIGRFIEAEQETEEYSTYKEADDEAESTQSGMIDNEAQFYAEGDNYDDESSYYLERAVREITDERGREVAQLRGQAPGERALPRPAWENTRHKGKWQSDGGRQYREMVLSVPTIEPYNSNDSTHFATDTKGRTVAWSRFKIHDDANGVPTIWGDEFQSQRAQHGKEQGFKTKAALAAANKAHAELVDARLAQTREEEAFISTMDPLLADLASLVNKPDGIEHPIGILDIFPMMGGRPYSAVAALRLVATEDYAPSSRVGEYFTDNPAAKEKAKELYTVAQERYAAVKAAEQRVEALGQAANIGRSGVPDAPFVKDTQAWTALILKRLVRYAVDNGITQIAWTTGAQNATRYGTSDQIDSLKWTKVEGGIQVEAMKDGAVVVDRKLDAAIELGQTLGNRVAQAIINSPDQSGEIASNDLDHVNGLGMQTYYGDASGRDPKGKPAIVPMVANKLVKALGGEGVKTINITVSEKGKTFEGAAGFQITPAMAEKVKGGFTLFQQENKPRGKITFGDSMSQPSTITLLANADLSTFLHESGHFFLEVMADIASQENAPQSIVDDLARTLNWFKPGMTPAEWQGMTLDEKRMYHEQFARGFEAYLFEGRAPSLELQGVFSRFRAWLLNVYRILTSANAKADSEKFQADYAARVGQPLLQLSDEVRGVMDRMLATNEQILEAEQARNFAPLFKTKPDGMTDAEWVAYQETDPKATQEAVDDLQRRGLRDMQWLTGARGRELSKLQKAAASRRKAVEKEITDEIRKEPVYAVQRWLKFGILDDGTETVGAKLDLPALKEMYGEDPAAPWRYLSVGRNGLAGNEGLHPDQVAEMFGFTSGDHLVRAILAAHPESSEIEGRTDQRMLERYGDLSSPAAISKAADEAIHNEARARFISTELRALDRAVNVREDTGRTVTDSRGRTRRITVAVLPKMAREFAAMIVARKKIGDVRPAQYATAEVRAAKAAEKAMAAGNLVEAATEKRNQLVNNYATRAAYEALAEIERGLRYLKRVGDSKTVDPEYRDQIDKMLERFELRQVTNREQERRQSLVKWVEQQQAAGFEPVIDEEMLDEARRQNYRTLSVEEFRGLVDAVKNIEHLGRLKKKLLTARDQREFAERVDEAAASIEAHAKKTLPTRLESNTWLDKMKSGTAEYFAMHRKFSSMLREMDGFRDAGVMWNLLGRPMNDAGNREAVMREEATLALVELLKPLAKLNMKAKVFIPAINASLSREGRIMVALNTGNEGNLQRLMDGDHWTPAQVRAVLDTLTKEEMDFVQSIWDFVGQYRDQIGEQQKRLTGVEPKWVEATPVETKHGTYKGGYIPAKYDNNRSVKALAMEAAQALMDQWRAKKGGKTRDSFTKARAAKVTDKPVRKDFGVITQHVTQVTHRLAWQEFLTDAKRLLSSAGISNAVKDHYGIEAWRAMDNTIDDIAAGEVGAQNVFESIVNHVRTGATIAGLAWRVTTSLLQPLGLTQSMVRIGTKYVAKGMVEWIGDAAKMENTAKRIYEKSDFMRLRGKTMQREISEIRNKVDGRNSAIEASYFYLIQKMQLVADIPTWLGQYTKAVELGADEATAVAQADQAVIDAQGSGQLQDLAGIQRGGPLMKLFTNFYSFFNTTYQNTVEVVGRTDLKNPLAVGLMAVDLLLLYTVPAVLGTLMKFALSGGDDEDKLVKKLIADQATYLFGTMVGVRELAGAIQTVSGLPGDYQGPASVRLVAEITKLGKQAGQGEIDEAFLKAADNVGGILFHYPAGQINATADGIYSLATGKTDNPGALLVGAK